MTPEQIDELRRLRDFARAVRTIVLSQDANDVTAHVIRKILRDKGLFDATEGK